MDTIFDNKDPVDMDYLIESGFEQNTDMDEDEKPGDVMIKKIGPVEIAVFRVGTKDEMVGIGFRLGDHLIRSKIIWRSTKNGELSKFTLSYILGATRAYME